ncbi:MAG: hypothetical protein A2255_10990 [Candidatus Melainabacteria bacterium RIFOXYA2_FULL_32_9]|nr:MAG: hypothetical protein A2255_10990 [Candidatus Melainabacteria bacterium RIFOXYA2_FULL_32_9]
MKELTENSMTVVILSIALSASIICSSKAYTDLGEVFSTGPSNQTAVEQAEIRERYVPPTRSFDRKNAVVHKKMKRWLNGKPAIVNILVINPKKSGVVVKPSFGSYFINSVKSVKEIVNREDALAGINASYFKPDNGAPLGLAILDGNIITGPLYRRVSFGVTKDKEFKMGKVDITGKINIGEDLKLRLFNINQPVFSKYAFTVYTDKWGKRTPITSQHYSHIVVAHDKVQYIKNSSVPVPRGGYVLVGPHYLVAGKIKQHERVDYSMTLIPDDWNDNIEYAISGGPYLVKNGKIFIDKQKFTSNFLWTKAPRTAVGFTKGGSLVMVTIDGRQKGVTEGATITELAKIMHELGTYDAMNLDGGTSTQMVVNGKLVNYPSVKGGGRVTNALVIVAPVFAAE